MKPKLKILLLITLALAFLAGALWYPYKATGIPQWKVVVIDADGNRLPNVQANEEWLDPLSEGVTFADFRRTDTAGLVVFPARQLHNRLLFGLRNAHPSAHIFVCWQDQFGDVFWDAEHPELPSSLILRRAPCGYG